jgi:hypothetical protein
MLGFEATIGVEEGLRRLVAWWRSEKQKESKSPSGDSARS